MQMFCLNLVHSWEYNFLGNFEIYKNECAQKLVLFGVAEPSITAREFSNSVLLQSRFQKELEMKSKKSQCIPCQNQVQVEHLMICCRIWPANVKHTVKTPVFGTLNSAISNFQTWFVRLWWKY